MICFEKHVLTEALDVVHKEEYSITCCVWYVYLTKPKPIRKRQTHPLVREDVI
jgi:hypothetical protein